VTAVDENEAMAERIARHTAAYEQLCRSAHGHDVTEVEVLVRDFVGVSLRWLWRPRFAG
jgi:hypothetical protein